MKIFTFALIPLILTMGITPAIPFDDASAIAYFPSPLKQILNGVSPENVTCTEGLVIVLKVSDNSPACLKPASSEKLIQRGWGIMLSDESSESNVSQIHQGYSVTAEQYEVNGNIISNVDVTADLWNPREKSAELIEQRADYMIGKFDLDRTPEQLQRAEEAKAKYADDILINSLLPASVGIVENTPELFEKALQRNIDAGTTLVSATVYAFPADGKMDILTRFDENQKVLDKLGIQLVNDVSSIRDAKSQGKMALIYNSQGAEYFIDDNTLLEQVKNRGLHISNFVYNSNNALAGGGNEQDMGVTDLGLEFIEEANRLGIIVDCSHSSTQTCIDAAEHSTKPILASHSNAYAIHPLNRNTHDEGLVAVAESGGAVCTVGVGLFLNDQYDASPESFAIHVDYTGDLIGRDKTCFATDYTHNYNRDYLTSVIPNMDLYPPEKGFGAPASNLAIEHVWGVVGVLEDDYDWSEEEIRGFLGENLLRVYDANWN